MSGPLITNLEEEYKLTATLILICSLIFYSQTIKSFPILSQRREPSLGHLVHCVLLCLAKVIKIFFSPSPKTLAPCLYSALVDGGWVSATQLLCIIDESSSRVSTLWHFKPTLNNAGWASSWDQRKPSSRESEMLSVRSFVDTGIWQHTHGIQYRERLQCEVKNW